MSAPLTWSSRSAHPTAARLSFRPSKLHLVVESTADKLEEAPLKLEALVSCATLYATQTPFQDPAKGEAYSTEALEIARTLDDRAAESKIYWIRMMSLTFAGGNPERARAFGEKSLAIAREYELHEQSAFTIGNLVVAYWGLDEIEPAQLLIREARGLWEKLNNLPMLADTFSLAIYSDIMLGNLDSAYVSANEMIEISRSIDNGRNLTAGTYHRGLVDFERGNFRRAIIDSEEARRLGELRAINFMYLNALGVLAHISALLGEALRTQMLGNEVVDRQDELPPLFRATTLRHVVQAFLQCGDLAAAERAAEKITLIDEKEAGFGWVFAQSQLIAGEISLANKDVEAALKLVSDILPRINQIGLKLGVAHALDIQGRALHMRGDLEQAEIALADAQGYMRACGAQIRLWPIVWSRSIIASSRGEYDKAAGLRTEARAVITQVAESIDSEDQREKFLSGSEVGRE